MYKLVSLLRSLTCVTGVDGTVNMQQDMVRIVSDILSIGFETPTQFRTFPSAFNRQCIKDGKVEQAFNQLFNEIQLQIIHANYFGGLDKDYSMRHCVRVITILLRIHLAPQLESDRIRKAIVKSENHYAQQNQQDYSIIRQTISPINMSYNAQRLLIKTE
ncbi:MAG: hypothetical protein EXX96DRAFT_537766 [Benjaminiella poitrasii]|nr:MAG: hypothetical protein EXX96DRAFT_537766 [Benjaminiella poitrasii]